LTTRHPQKPAGSAFAPRLALFYAASFAAIGLWMPLFPLWLTARGLDAQLIGLVLALPMAVRVVAIPLATREADRRDALRGTLMLLSVAAAAVYPVLAFVEGPLAIAIVIVLGSIVWTPVVPLTDAFALKGLPLRGKAYGPVRLWGSAAYVAASLTAGLLIDLVQGRHLIWFLSAAMIIIGVASLALARLELAPLELAPLDLAPAPPHSQRPKLFLRIPGLLAVALAASLIQASHAVYYGFSTLDWRAAGLDGTTIGALWGIGVVAEIALFALSARLPARISPAILLAIGAAGATVRWAGMALDPPAWLLPLLQCLHGLSFGATHLASVSFLAKAAPSGSAATAQGTLSVVQGLVMAAAMAASGQLYAAFGGHAYGAMALLAAAGGAIALAVQRARTA
jgi:MFS transporter, PPP family, 3-phenylpropionic acid transporter